MQLLTTLTYPFLREFSPKLLPKRGLQNLKRRQWQATTHDPQFRLSSVAFRVVRGWISISVTMRSEEHMVPKLYFNFGEGYSEARSITLLPIDETTYQAEVMLPSPPKGIRFDPCEKACRFFMDDITIKLHSELLYVCRQFLFLSYNDYCKQNNLLRIFKLSYTRYKKHGLTGMLERLEKEYSKLYPSRVQKVTLNHVAYLHWIEKNENRHLMSFPKKTYDYQPRISIVMPTYNTEVSYLKKAIESVIAQHYSHWELCIADDASTKEDTLALLKAYATQYQQIKILFRKTNGHISHASNSALKLVTGEYVAFLDHDDMLAPNALSEVVATLNRRPEAKLLYSDEDKIDENGGRYEPHFKSDWNADMLLSQNYLSHLLIVEKSHLDRVGHFREGFEGAQDYELILRITESLSASHIVHIDTILYHWRAHTGSTALHPEEKGYTSEAGLNALKNYIARKPYPMCAEKGLLPNLFKVTYPLAEEPLVSIIIPTRDSYTILSLCIQSILNHTSYRNYEIVIVDNQTCDPETLAYFDILTKHYSHIRILRYDKPFNYAAINNFAVSQVEGEVIALLNNDVEVISSHWLTEMVEHAVRPEIAAVGAKLYYDDNTIQHAGVILGIGGVAGHSHKYFPKEAYGYFSRLKIIQNLSAVTAACLVVKKSLYEEVGGLDADNLEIAFNDIDFCLKLQQKGYRNLWTPYVELYHHESLSRGAEDTKIKQARFEKEVLFMKEKWGEVLMRDRYYNRHLTRKYEDFRIARDE